MRKCRWTVHKITVDISVLMFWREMYFFLSYIELTFQLFILGTEVPAQYYHRPNDL